MSKMTLMWWLFPKWAARRRISAAIHQRQRDRVVPLVLVGAMSPEDGARLLHRSWWKRLWGKP